MASTSSADVVRAWLAENGEDVGGKRGRLKNDQIAKFNDAHKSAPYAAGKRVETRKITGTRTLSNGKKVPRTVTVSLGEVRTGLNEAGISVSPVGRIPENYMKAFASGPEAMAALADSLKA